MKTIMLPFAILCFFSTVYGQTADTTLRGTFTDPRDGHAYAWVRIGTQDWMAENLHADHFRNGDPVAETVSRDEWNRAARENTPAWCYFDFDPANGKTYGKLYNWHAVNDPRGLAPEGWHISTDTEWVVLSEFLGRWNVAGGKLKESGTSHWNSPNKKATNESGFTGLPGGFNQIGGKFNGMGRVGGWWSSTGKESTNMAWANLLGYEDTNVHRLAYTRDAGFSVRCVKD